MANATTSNEGSSTRNLTVPVHNLSKNNVIVIVHCLEFTNHNCVTTKAFQLSHKHSVNVTTVRERKKTEIIKTTKAPHGCTLIVARATTRTASQVNLTITTERKPLRACKLFGPGHCDGATRKWSKYNNFKQLLGEAIQICIALWREHYQCILHCRLLWITIPATKEEGIDRVCVDERTTHQQLPIRLLFDQN